MVTSALWATQSSYTGHGVGRMRPSASMCAREGVAADILPLHSMRSCNTKLAALLLAQQARHTAFDNEGFSASPLNIHLPLRRPAAAARAPQTRPGSRAARRRTRRSAGAAAEGSPSGAGRSPRQRWPPGLPCPPAGPAGPAVGITCRQHMDRRQCAQARPLHAWSPSMHSAFFPVSLPIAARHVRDACQGTPEAPSADVLLWLHRSPTAGLRTLGVNSGAPSGRPHGSAAGHLPCPARPAQPAATRVPHNEPR